MSARLIEPGSVLGDRYRVEDMLVGEGRADSWRGFDQVLARSVVLQVLPSSSPYAERLLSAAKRASRVTDPRILQVLDAVDDGALTYVVREWVDGEALEVVLGEGPLPARRAVWLLRELADAMASAHQLGVTHRRLAPDTVVVTSVSGVKIIGLGTLAALHADELGDSDPAGEDTVALGRLLYACLTARWPGAGSAALPEAPQSHGRYLRPRQVRAGVPRALDELCDRILSGSGRYGEPPTTAAQIRDELTPILAVEHPSEVTAGRTFNESGDFASVSLGEAPALLPRTGSDPLPEAPPAAATGASVRRSTLPIPLVWTAVAVLILGTMLLAYLIGQRGVPRDREPRTASSPSGAVTSAAPQPLQIAGATSFDPFPGSGDEHPELVSLAIDGDLSTAWETFTYRNDPALGGLKTGVGLVLDLGRVQDVRLITVALQGVGTTLQLRAAPATASVAPAQAARQYRLIGTASDVGSSATFRLGQAVPTRYLLLWLTSLPPEGPSSYRGRVAEVEVFG